MTKRQLPLPHRGRRVATGLRQVVGFQLRADQPGSRRCVERLGLPEQRGRSSERDQDHPCPRWLHQSVVTGRNGQHPGPRFPLHRRAFRDFGPIHAQPRPAVQMVQVPPRTPDISDASPTGQRTRLRWASGARCDKACLVGDHHKLRAVVGAELHQKAADVRLGGRCGDVQSLADLSVRPSARDLHEHLSLARR
jgi:hypothetical protein